MKKLRDRILVYSMISSIVIIVIISSVSLFSLNNVKNMNIEEVNMMLRENFDMKIKAQVEQVVSLLNEYNKKAETGEYTLEEAKKKAADAVRELSYGDNSYFWVDTYEGVNVVYLGNDTEGKSRINDTDADGTPYIKAIIENGRKEGGGFTDYNFPRPGQTEPLPKRGYSLAFEPFGWVIGTGNYTDDIDKAVNEKKIALQHITDTTVLYTALASVIVIFLAGLMFFLFGNRLAKPIEAASEYLAFLSEGDFTRKVRDEEKIIKNKDETGQLIRSLLKMRASVMQSVGIILEQSSETLLNVEKSKKNLDMLKDEIEKVSSTTQEISAGMEETAAAAQHVSSTAEEIETAVENIAVKAQEGAEEVIEISRRAEELKFKAINSRKYAEEIYGNTKETLLRAIEDSKAVEQIRALSDTILQITAQTNLLSLNAAIEAARAGESGRGFGVVANEIKQLAEDSKLAASEIKKVTDTVLTSVGNLSEGSQNILGFINGQVISDYDFLVHTGELYSDDSAKISDIITDFSATAQELTASIGSVTNSIGNISAAVNQTAISTQDIAEKNMEIDGGSKELLAQTNAVEESAYKLKEAVARFKIS